MKSTFALLLKVVLPIAIGLGVIYMLFGNEVAGMSIKTIDITDTTVIGLIVAVLLLIARQTGLAWRFRTLTDNRLKWRSSCKVSILCDFTSAITPTSAGGSMLSMIFLHKEGIKLGRATAITMLTLFLDEMFLIIATPILIIIAGKENVFGFTNGASADNLMAIFYVIFGITAFITLLLAIGLFKSPHRIANGLNHVFSWKILSRWQKSVREIGENLVTTSHEIKQKRADWWIKPILSTIIIWSCRFVIVNALFYAFFPEADQLTVLARQFIVWMLLIFIPTPGGAGVSEILFKTYYSDFVGGPLLALLAISWRIFTYYIFLIMGVFMIPSYLKLSRHKDKMKNDIQS